MKESSAAITPNRQRGSALNATKPADADPVDTLAETGATSKVAAAAVGMDAESMSIVTQMNHAHAQELMQVRQIFKFFLYSIYMLDAL